MSSHQPIIKVEDISVCDDDDKKRNNNRRCRQRQSPLSSPKCEQAKSPSSSQEKKKQKHIKKHGSAEKMPLGESSLGAKLGLNLHIRRKSSPCIGGIPASASAAAADDRGEEGNCAQNTLFPTTNSSGRHSSRKHSCLDDKKSYNPHRRLSSPPSFDREELLNRGAAGGFGGLGGGGGGGGGNNSSSSNHSSGGNSLTQLAISGLNASSTDIRENTVRSGHQDIRTLYAPNNVTYPPENISINLVNAPDDSTMQCDCGHINCPLCNLMMNLELTDPSLLK